MSEVENMDVVPEPTIEKKRRGRPPKIARESPDEIISPDDAPKEPKERKKRAPKEAPVDKGALARKLQGWHQLAAMLTKTPELAIEDDEAEMLVGDVLRLSQEYGISLSGKTAAWLALAGSAAMIYIPRAMLITAKIQQARHRVPTPPAGVIM